MGDEMLDRALRVRDEINEWTVREKSLAWWCSVAREAATSISDLLSRIRYMRENPDTRDHDALRLYATQVVTEQTRSLAALVEEDAQGAEDDLEALEAGREFLVTMERTR